MINILYTIPNFMTAGSGKALLNLAERLDRDRFSPSICVLKRGGALERRAEQAGIPVIEAPFTLPARPRAGLPFRAWRTAAQFRPYHFDLWHSFHYLDDYTEPLIARAAGARWLYTKKNMSWGGRAWHVRSFLAARIVTQNSAMGEQFFSSPLTRRKAHLIPRGVDAAQYRPGVEPVLQLRQRLDLPSGAPLIGCVANLIPLKGHPPLLHALFAIKEAHLVLAGRSLDERYTDKLKALCHELNISSRVHFLGPVENVPALHAELDIFALPTAREGSPVALLEAMACGVPCVVSDIPAARDIIEPGQSGLLFPLGDVSALAAAIRDLLASSSRRSAMGEAARQRILSHYTIEREVAQHEALYAELTHL